jgi:hypothetical protein
LRRRCLIVGKKRKTIYVVGFLDLER